MVSALKEFCALSFFKGVLLRDEHGILEKPGENSQSSRLIRFTDIREIHKLQSVLKAYLFEAIELEKAGLKVDFKAKTALILPEELTRKLEESKALKVAFESLTPGRQRGYVLYFSSAKQSKTRDARIEKYTPKIFEGKGIHE